MGTASFLQIKSLFLVCKKFLLRQATSRGRTMVPALGHFDESWSYPGLVLCAAGGEILDRELGKTLYDRVDGMEEKQLELTLEHNKTQGLDTKAVQARLNEIRSGR